jgi:hypothetical protein
MRGRERLRGAVGVRRQAVAAGLVAVGPEGSRRPAWVVVAVALGALFLAQPPMAAPAVGTAAAAREAAKARESVPTPAVLPPAGPARATPPALAAATPAAAAGAGGDAAAVLERYAAAIVRVEAILETRLDFDGQGEVEDSRLDLLGAVVDPQGLVMIWNSHVSSARISEMLAESGRGGQMGIRVVPRSFTVSLPEGDVPALLAATDSVNDLAFLQLLDPPAAPLAHVDFAAGRRPTVGDEVLAVSRLGRGFDHAPVLHSARVGGLLRRPREAWILDGTLPTFGLPVFDARGVPVGALTTVVTRGRDGDAAAGRPSVGQMLGGAVGLAGDGPIGVFVLPAERVRSLIGLAGERARQLLAERAAAAATDDE